MAFSDTIDADMRTTGVYIVRDAEPTFNALGDPIVGVTTIASGLTVDVQPAIRNQFAAMARGADYDHTHVVFGDVPGSAAESNDRMVADGTTYVIRSYRDYKTHAEYDAEALE